MEQLGNNYSYRRTAVVNCVDETMATAIFVFLGCGISVIAGPAVGALGIAIAFALALFTTSLLFSGFHNVQFNPGLTIALYCARIQPRKYAHIHRRFWYYTSPYELNIIWVIFKLIGQLLGALAGAILVMILVLNSINHVDPAKLGLAQNGWGVGFQSEYNMVGAILVESIGSIILFYIISRSLKNFFAPMYIARLAALVFFTLHLVAYPVTGASMNFARSFGPETISFLGRFARDQDGLGSDVAFVAFCNSLYELLLFLVISLFAGILSGLAARYRFPPAVEPQ